VKPETVIAWHGQGFRLYWTWKSRRHSGRPTVATDLCVLIRTMAHTNPLWGAPRIHGELLKLGLEVSQATVAKYMPRRTTPPSQTWRTFLANHVHQIAAADFFVVPTATCRLLFVLVILAHERRRIVHVAVTDHPTAAWCSAKNCPEIVQIAKRTQSPNNTRKRSRTSVTISTGALASKTARRTCQSRFFTWSARTAPPIVPPGGRSTSNG
jgi:hypothetical protein